jgi:TRAP transporter 4TM/12TM fusion protein
VTALARGCALLLPLFVLFQVNYPTLQPQTQLAVFAGLGVMLCFLRPDGTAPGSAAARGLGRHLELALALLSGAVFSYVAVQSEPFFSSWWLEGRALGDRAGLEQPLDILIAIVGLALVFEAARRTVGWALPILAGAFLLYGFFGASLPAWLLPHRGYGLDRLAAQTFLHSQGVFGIALTVMFTYVFLFVLFGAVLEATGTTHAVVELARRLFRKSVGGPAKVAVLSSGMMGSLSGSAVANTATTGTFTIPMMRGAGFSRELAGGIEAAASSGGALVPPVMGAGAYMMLELVEPTVTYLEIVRAALLPACLYYLSLLLLVHFQGRRAGIAGLADVPLGAAATPGLEDAREADVADPASENAGGARMEMAVFAAGLGALLALLLTGFSVFRAVTGALAAAVALAAAHPRTRLSLRRLGDVCVSAARATTPLVAAAACVGVVIGVVTLTGVGTRLPALILDLAQGNLLGALGLIMVSSIILGMGLPSAVCYLLMATLIGPALGGLGIVPLAAHLFIFYFGMMSMVTPPVALAAYTASSIAGSRLVATSFAAFRCALIGFVLPFLFVFRPQLLMLDTEGTVAGAGAVLFALAVAVAGVVPLAAAIGGHWLTPLDAGARLLLGLGAGGLLLPPQAAPGGSLAWWNVAGALLVAAVFARQWWRKRRAV